jgi:uncharacterized iron-regulated protein
MTAAHCGLIDDDKAMDLARTQMARDQSMAGVLLASNDADLGAVLIAGSSHVRKSTGIPSLLPPSEAASVALIETEAMSDAFIGDPDGVTGQVLSEFDYIWFTPKTDETSFCERIGN